MLQPLFFVLVTGLQPMRDRSFRRSHPQNGTRTVVAIDGGDYRFFCLADVDICWPFGSMVLKSHGGLIFDRRCVWIYSISDITRLTTGLDSSGFHRVFCWVLFRFDDLMFFNCGGGSSDIISLLLRIEWDPLDLIFGNGQPGKNRGPMRKSHWDRKVFLFCPPFQTISFVYLWYVLEVDIKIARRRNHNISYIRHYQPTRQLA